MTTRRDFVLGGSALVAGLATANPAASADKPPPKPAVSPRRFFYGNPPPPATGSLAELPDNTARDLGSFVWRDSTDRNITDYSGLAYDPVAKRMCIFGGGHGPCQWTDIRAYNLGTLRWSSVYVPTPRGEMTLSNGDSDEGRWISTNQPYARHSYNMSLVLGRRFYLMTPVGMPSDLDGPSPAWGGRICWYDFNRRAWSYSRIANAATPWYYACAAAADPRTRLILVIGPNRQAGLGNLWLYDPAADAISTGPSLPDVGYALDLVYFPPNDRFYALQSDGRVWEINFDRASINLSTITRLATSGSPPPASGACGFAYDSVNRIIGGNIVNGRFHAFDPVSRTWTTVPVQTLPGTANAPDQAFHCLDFDPASGCFIFLSNPATATTWAYRYRGSATTSAAPAPRDLAVSLDFGGGVLALFEGAASVDQGEFVGEFVRQRSYVATNPQFPDWRVHFRIDVDANGSRIVGALGRDEVVVEYGRSASGVPVHVTSPYTATILKSGASVATYRVPAHWWYARWRHQPAPRPVVRSPQSLIARGWLPKFGPLGLFGLTPNRSAVSWIGPMRAPRDAVLGAFAPVMGVAGDNPQIGYLTEYAADYVLNQSPESLVSLRTEGEWCGNWCMHIRDDATGAPVDSRIARYKSDGGSVNPVPRADPASSPGFVALESAHFYPCANLPWLLTDDPYYLEELQFAVSWQILFDAYHRVNQRLPGLVYPGETRAFAWGMRDLFLLAVSCPTSVPSWLRPRSYWQSCVDDNRAYAMRYVASPAKVATIFRAWTRSDMVAAWMSSWLNAVVGFAVGQGFGDWRPIFDWGIDMHIQQTNGTSGWSRQWPVPYYFFPKKSGNGTPSGYYTDASVDAITCGSWAEAWEFFKSGSGGLSPPVDTSRWDPAAIMQSQSGPSYFLHLRSALAVAVTQGVPGAKDCYDYVHAQMASTIMPRYRGTGQARFSIDP